jgi:hypothetical protein
MDPVKTDKLIYLDAEFISAKYEEIKKVNPATQLTRTEGLKAGISVPMLSAGAHTQETKSFSISTRQMYQEISKDIEKYPNFEPERFENHKGTKIVWLEGEITIAEWVGSQDKDDRYEFYELGIDNKRVAFLTHREYFASGFSEVFEASTALKGNISIPVRVLARVMWYVETAKNYTACPYLIFEK